MQVPSSQPGQQAISSAIETSSQAFVETIEYSRFVEFCDACRRFRYIGLCYGPPGFGKTLSALRYSRAEMIIQFDRWTSELRDQLPINTVFYTASVINTPSRVDFDIRSARERLMSIALRPIRREATEVLDAIRLRDEAKRREILNNPDAPHVILLRSTQHTFKPSNFMRRERRRFRTPRRSPWSMKQTAADEQPRADAIHLRRRPCWDGSHRHAWHRKVTRLLTQIERVLDVNDLQIVSIEVVEAARDSLVIGQS